MPQAKDVLMSAAVVLTKSLGLQPVFEKAAGIKNEKSWGIVAAESALQFGLPYLYDFSKVLDFDNLANNSLDRVALVASGAVLDGMNLASTINMSGGVDHAPAIGAFMLAKLTNNLLFNGCLETAKYVLQPSSELPPDNK